MLEPIEPDERSELVVRQAWQVRAHAQGEPRRDDPQTEQLGETAAVVKRVESDAVAVLLA